MGAKDWLTGDGVQLLFVTRFGDAFLRRSSDGAILWLNVAEGQLVEVAPTMAELDLKASDPDLFDRWFMPEVVLGQESLGIKPGRNQCFHLAVPPVFGGQLDPDNIELADIAVHFSIHGQLYQQVKDLPPGTRIDQIKLVGPEGEKKPWWRFW